MINSQANRRNLAGMTLVELLMALALFSILITVAATLFNSTRKLSDSDTASVTATQNVRSALDIMAADIRQAGENLGTLNVKVTGLDFDNATKTLTVRKAIPDFRTQDLPASYPATASKSIQALPICGLLSSNKQVQVAITNNAGCPYNAVDSTPNAEDQNVAAWRQYFSAQGGRAQAAIIYTPGSATTATVSRRIRVNSVSPVTYTSTTSSGITTYKRSVSLILNEAVPTSVTATNGSLIVLIDERTYFMDTTNKKLMFLQGADATSAQPLAFGITGFDTSATISGASGGPDQTITSQSVLNDQNGAIWARIKEVKVALTGTGNPRLTKPSRSFTSTIFPRNIENVRGSN